MKYKCAYMKYKCAYMTLRRDQKEKDFKKMLLLHSISFSHVTTKKFYLNLFKEFLYHQYNTYDYPYYKYKE